MKRNRLIIYGEIDAGGSVLANALNGNYIDNDFYKCAKVKDSIIKQKIENIFTYYDLINAPYGEVNDTDKFANTQNIKRQINDSKNVICLVIVSCKGDNIITTAQNSLSSFNLINNEVDKILVFTKIDYNKPIIDKEQIKQEYGVAEIFETSCIKGIGIKELRNFINESFDKLNSKNKCNKLFTIINQLSDSLCLLIAKNPDYLMNVEWRDLERLIAKSLEGIGFSVILTPSSKDGGKDVIVSCIINNKRFIYYIEIKHWTKNGKVGNKEIETFVELNIDERTSGGLFLSTSGYTNKVIASLNKITKQKVRIGDSLKIVTLCKRYIKTKEGVVYPQSILPKVLFEESY